MTTNAPPPTHPAFFPPHTPPAHSQHDDVWDPTNAGHQPICDTLTGAGKEGQKLSETDGAAKRVIGLAAAAVKIRHRNTLWTGCNKAPVNYNHTLRLGTTTEES